MGRSVVTTVAIKKMLQARAGIQPLAKIVGVAFGDGAVVDGALVQPDPDTPYLRNEIYRQENDGYTIISDTCIRYICTLAKDTLKGNRINEMALYDADGDLVAIKSFLDKGKDEDIEMVFEIDDTFYKEEE